MTNLLGPEGWGFVIAQERLGPGRIHHCMQWLGICSRVYDLMCKRATARIYDGADEVHKMSVAKRILKEYAGRTVR